MMGTSKRATVAVAVGMLAMSGAPSGQTGGAAAIPNGIRSKIACADMKDKTVPASAIGLPTGGAVVTTARLEPGSGPVAIKANFVPEYCFIRGTIKSVDPNAPPINFGIALPTVWNQQTFQIAGNGGNGFIPL